ncbi:MAG: type IX secretion system membrane protein PorP/SprF [Bacteroidales bacterium]|jgi:type IX secretion system PorP/SprF family membrane protein
MKKLFITLLFLFSLQMMSIAQNDIQFSNYMFSEITYNPAMAGNSSTLDATLLARQQWTGFAQAPETELFTANCYVDKLSGGVGLSFINDKLGFENSQNLKLMYAYQLRITEKSRLSFGLAFGVLNYSLQGSQLIYNDMTDPNDVLTTQHKAKPDFDFGVAYNASNYAIGLSSTHIDQSLSSATVLDAPRHYYLYAKYKIKAAEKINVIPSIQVRSAMFITQFEVSALMYYASRFWIGASYRPKDAVVGLIGVEITKNFRVGYSYDYNSGPVKSYSGGSHEILVMGSFNVSPKIVPTKTPRFFN